MKTTAIARWTRAALLAGAAALAGCTSDEPARPAAEPAKATGRGKAELVMAPEGGDDVATVVRAELERARQDGRDLVVYVGAPWCEPCTRFHKAVEAGELDAAFPTLRLLEFDHDRDEARLVKAGYRSRLIPLFVAPSSSGEASAIRMEGSVKGERAVAEIVPRLTALVAQARAAGR